MSNLKQSVMTDMTVKTVQFPWGEFWRYFNV